MGLAGYCPWKMGFKSLGLGFAWSLEMGKKMSKIKNGNEI